MKRSILAFAAIAAFAASTGAGATDTRTLSEFLLSCGSSSRICHINVEDYLQAARDQGLICPPPDLSVRDAASEELNWLRENVVADKALQNSNVEDAQWAAVNALWPCGKN